MSKKHISNHLNKKKLHASCEDYRASATIDLEHDKKDRNKNLTYRFKYYGEKEE